MSCWSDDWIINIYLCQYFIFPYYPGNIVRDLGVYFDSELTMKLHVSKVVSVCCYQLQKLHHLHSLVNQTVLKQVVTLFVLSCIDYCNLLLINLPTSTTVPLQRVQNDAAHWAHIISALKHLHWLPVPYSYNLKPLHSCTRSAILTALSILSTWSVSRQMRQDNVYVLRWRGRQLQFVLPLTLENEPF